MDLAQSAPQSLVTMINQSIMLSPLYGGVVPTINENPIRNESGVVISANGTPQLTDWTGVDGRHTRYRQDVSETDITPNPCKRQKKSRSVAQKELRDMKIKGESRRINPNKQGLEEKWCSSNQWCPAADFDVQKPNEGYRTCAKHKKKAALRSQRNRKKGDQPSTKSQKAQATTLVSSPTTAWNSSPGMQPQPAMQLPIQILPMMQSAAGGLLQGSFMLPNVDSSPMSKTPPTTTEHKAGHKPQPSGPVHNGLPSKAIGEPS